MTDDVDALVNKWAYEQFKKETKGWSRDNRQLWHLRECSEIEVSGCDHQWSCGCYSEYTRDDQWELGINLICPHEGLVGYKFREVKWGYLPEILEELARLDLEDFVCSASGESDPDDY